jgi:ABC-2 type transport system ATP-binding protein
VGIIEQGRLLAVGSVEEISAGAVEMRSEVRLRVLGDAAPSLAWLRARHDVTDVAVRAGQVIFTHAGGPQDQAALLRELIAAEFPIVEFGSKTKSLEDVFLHVTEGRVQ